MLSLEEAQQRILSSLTPLASETVPLAQAAGRFLAQPLRAAVDLPPFDNSAMDGYAVRAADVAQAGAGHPAALRLAGRIAAGEAAAVEVTAGACVRLFTGSPLPRGADSVVMQEDAQPDPEDPNRVLILDKAKPWENVRFQGEDTKAGSELFDAGERLTASRLALAGAVGVGEIVASRQPIVGIIATGSELRAPGQPLGPGQIYESNRLTLAALLERAGAIPKLFPFAPDDLAATRQALETAAGQCDAIVTSGGVSVGEFDHVKAAIEHSGGALDFWQVAIKPGKPFMFGRCGRAFVFGVPGNPVSAFVTCLLLVRPAILRLQGAANLALPNHLAPLSEPLANHGDRRHFMRVVMEPDGHVRSAGAQASHRLGSLAAADGLVDVPPESILRAGTTVRVYRWD